MAGRFWAGGAARGPRDSEQAPEQSLGRIGVGLVERHAQVVVAAEDGLAGEQCLDLCL